MLCFLSLCLRVLMLGGISVPAQFGYVAQMPGTPALVLLAHNDFSGRYFHSLSYEDPIYYQGKTYRVTELLSLQALTPDSPTSEFVNLESGKYLTTNAAWYLAYDRPGYIVLQTCIPRGDVKTWGRFFVIAERDFEIAKGGKELLEISP